MRILLLFFILSSFVSCSSTSNLYTKSQTTYLFDQKQRPFQIYKPLNLSSNTKTILFLYEGFSQKQLAEKMAKEFAKQNFQVVTIDIYRDSPKSKNAKLLPLMAKKIFSSKTYIENQITAIQNALLKKKIQTNQFSVVAFGHAAEYALKLPRMGMLIENIILFYPIIQSKPQRISTNLLIFGGKNDRLYSASALEDIYDLARDSKREVLFINYPGVQHGFNNPIANEIASRYKLPYAYNQRAALDSQMKVISYLHRQLAK